MNVPQQTRNDQINAFYILNCTWGSSFTAQTLEPSKKSTLQAHKRQHLCYHPTTASLWKATEPSASNPQQRWSPEEQDRALRTTSAGTKTSLSGWPPKGNVALLLLCLAPLAEAPPEHTSQHSSGMPCLTSAVHCLTTAGCCKAPGSGDGQNHSVSEWGLELFAP